ncbi:RHS repeat-associated core domain contiaing protein [Lysinibacillus sphaericus OT4b.31]|uniref:RHS repeat-associated core domain contiaing protein n=2 Tax=Lysinibacillus sphaericus TaxID=1421 RepID=R7ZK29_LYSSH|nr:RHS repeat-associated core domain contiaing protein [Lysinibacillus sphaericus OT4b.31]
MMSKVIRPDKTEVTFKYDSLGRRIEKSSDEKITSFVWDGNTILHEYFTQNDSVELENDNLVTWVFNDGFVPSAKITSERNYSIISDYLGTPVEAYDGEGNKVWSAELDVYGRVKEFTGEQDFIPFRYQGQYEDVEIGLYYNRFRYYDPEQGNYTQIDPIGLAGGNPTLYGYVHDPNMEIDSFGLARAPSQVLAGNRKKTGDKISGFQAHHVITTNTWKTHQSFFNSIGMGGLRDEAFNGIMMPGNPNTLKGSSFSMIHNTQHPMYSDYVMSRVTDISDQYSLGLINEKEARTDIRKLQIELKNKIQKGHFDTVQSRKYPKCQRLG